MVSCAYILRSGASFVNLCENFCVVLFLLILKNYEELGLLIDFA